MAHSDKQMLSIFLTTTCNLNCIYCYAHNDLNNIQIISKEFAFWGIRYYYEEYILERGAEKRIRFYGPGEPTTQFSLLKEISEYAVSIWGKDTKIEVQTNGCFTEDVCQWLFDYTDNVWISCDGMPEIQNYNRPLWNSIKLSAPIMEKNIKKLTESRRCIVGIRSTVTDLNVQKQKDNVKYFHSLGVKYVWVDPIFPGVGDDIQNFHYIDMDKFVDNFLEATKFAATLDMEYRTFLAVNFDTETDYHCRACYLFPHLTTDGFLSACDMALHGSIKSNMDSLIYGRWDEQKREVLFEQKKMQTIMSRKCSKMIHCNDCVANRHCGGYCLGEILNETGDIYGQKLIACKAIRRLFKELPKEYVNYKYKHP